MKHTNGKNTILVTGGAGFLGSHLCAALLKRGERVTCLDDFSTGSRDTVAPLAKYEDFTIVEWDVTRPYHEPCAKIYNLACPASPVQYQKDPVRTIRVNVLGMANMLELARENSARILQTSTSEVYGDPMVHPQPESYWGNVNPIGPRSCYDDGKRAAETLCMDYHRQHGVDIKIIRIFNTYGPCMAPDDGRVVSNFIMQALRGKDITIYGDGSQTRSFCYVDDLIQGMIAMMESEDCTGPVNLGNPGECTMLELAEKILKLTKSSANIVFGPLPADDPRKRKPDIGLAKLKLGWEPKISLEDGLEKTIAYFREKEAQNTA